MDCAVAGGDCARPRTTRTGRRTRPSPPSRRRSRTRRSQTRTARRDPAPRRREQRHRPPRPHGHPRRLLHALAGDASFDAVKADPASFGLPNPRRFAYHYVLFTDHTRGFFSAAPSSPGTTSRSRSATGTTTAGRRATSRAATSTATGSTTRRGRRRSRPGRSCTSWSQPRAPPRRRRRRELQAQLPERDELLLPARRDPRRPGRDGTAPPARRLLARGAAGARRERAQRAARDPGRRRQDVLLHGRVHRQRVRRLRPRLHPVQLRPRLHLRPGREARGRDGSHNWNNNCTSSETGIAGT